MRSDSWQRALGGAVLLLAFGASAPPVRAQQAEPLALRISDAEGEPGGPVTILVRTYASRPVSQGRLGVRTTSGGFAGAPVGVGAPFASFDGGVVYGVNGDVIASLVWNETTQSVQADFSSATASINASDGIVAELDFTLDAGASPGVWDINFDAAVLPFLQDAHGNPMPYTTRGGTLQILAPGSPATLEVGGPKVHPGAYAEIEIETLEPFPVGQGTIDLHFPSALLLEPIDVRTDPFDRHGSVLITGTTLLAPGHLRVTFDSPGDDFNETPGTLFVIGFRTDKTTPIGTVGALTLDAVETTLLAPGGAPIALNRLGDVVEFINDPGIFHDNFEWGHTGGWSYPGP